MSAIVQRVQQLGLPLDQFVVIGSGLLDAVGIRAADDIDLVLRADLFARLVKQPEWEVGVKNTELVITKGDVEAFLSWSSDSHPNFSELYEDGVEIDGIRFANPAVITAWKRQHPSEKNTRDIALLEEYLAHA